MSLLVVGLVCVSIAQTCVFYFSFHARGQTEHHIPEELLAFVRDHHHSIGKKEHNVSLSMSELQSDSAVESSVWEDLSKYGSDLRPRLEFLWEDLSNHVFDQTLPQRSRLLPYAIGGKTRIQADDITLVTHGSISKLPRLLLLIQRWHGPVSIGLYMTRLDDVDKFLNFLKEHQTLLHKTNIHVMFEITRRLYPANVLRNLAMDNSESDYFLALDCDLIPSSEDAHKGLYDLLHSHSKMRELIRSKAQFVLPAFDIEIPSNLAHVTEDLLPTSKQEVIDRVESGGMVEFWKKECPSAYNATNYPLWFSNDTNEYYPIEYFPKFEPYVLGYRHGLPQYWPLFRGFGYNKASWFVELDRMGYRFMVLRDFFVSHMNHRRKNMKDTRKSLMKNGPHMKVFLEYLERTYAK